MSMIDITKGFRQYSPEELREYALKGIISVGDYYLSLNSLSTFFKEHIVFLSLTKLKKMLMMRDMKPEGMNLM